jgi:hypothetical protein
MPAKYSSSYSPGDPPDMPMAPTIFDPCFTT